MPSKSRHSVIAVVLKAFSGGFFGTENVELNNKNVEESLSKVADDFKMLFE